MSNDRHLQSRRTFACSTAATAMAALGAIPDRSPAAEPQASPARKSKIRIGTRISPAWMRSQDDADLRFLKQIGVDALDIELVMVKGYRETGTITRPALRELMGRFEAVGLRIERANALGDYILNAHLDRPEGRREIDNLKRIGEILAEAEIPVYGIQACQASHARRRRPRRLVPQEGRGGYGYPAFDLAASEASRAEAQVPRHGRPALEGAAQHLPAGRPRRGGEQDADRHARQRSAALRVPGQPADPLPLRRLRPPVRRSPEPAQRHDVLRRDAVRVGRGCLRRHPATSEARASCSTSTSATSAARCRRPGGYEEVFVDDGDLDMAKVLRALDEVGYDGVIDYDHPISVAGDGPLPKQYIAFAVGYMRGLIQSLGG